MTDDAEIRGHEQQNRRNARSLAEPARLRLLSVRLQMHAQRPATFDHGSPDRIDRQLAEHEAQMAGIVATMATVLDACAERIEVAEAALRDAVGGAP